MARTYTIEFFNQSKTYVAVISHVDGGISIYLPDEDLHDIIPAGKVLYHPEQGIKINGHKLTAEQNLVLSVRSSTELKNRNSAS